MKPQRALKNSACLLKACRHDYHGDEDDDCGPSIGSKKLEQHRLIRKKISAELFSCRENIDRHSNSFYFYAEVIFQYITITYCTSVQMIIV